MTDRKLMKQALHTLEGWANVDDWVWPETAKEQAKRNTVDAIAALRERLAQPEQEPVAWVEQIIDDLHALHDSEMIREIDSGDALIRLDAAISAVEEAEQRYTAPPQRPPLTVVEIMREWNSANSSVVDFARAIEAAHGIKGEA